MVKETALKAKLVVTPEQRFDAHSKVPIDGIANQDAWHRAEDRSKGRTKYARRPLFHRLDIIETAILDEDAAKPWVRTLNDLIKAGRQPGPGIELGQAREYVVVAASCGVLIDRIWPRNELAPGHRLEIKASPWTERRRHEVEEALIHRILLTSGDLFGRAEMLKCANRGCTVERTKQMRIYGFPVGVLHIKVRALTPACLLRRECEANRRGAATLC